jgi:hypothetical protein
VVHYSQSGQLTRIVESILSPLRRTPEIEIVLESPSPIQPYPFPWPVHRFLAAFPESVAMDPPEIRPPALDPEPHFDLVILAYTVWYLAPSPPITAFLRSEAAKVMKDTPVITVVNARDKWLTAQERVKEELARVGGRLIDNVAFVHQGNSIQHLVTTLRWLWTGRTDAFWRLFPPAGVDASEIEGASRFGRAIRDALARGECAAGRPILDGLGAARVSEDIVIQEALAYPHFVFWANLIRAAGKPGSARRAPLLLLFSLYLSGMVLAAIPILVLYKLFLRPWSRKKAERWIAYYELPSGSSTEKSTAGAYS